MNFVVLAWIACLLYGLVAFLSKLISKYSIANAWYFNFVWAGFVLIFTIPLAIYNHTGLPKEWLNLFLASFFYTTSGLLYIFALYKLDISVMSPMFNFRSVIGVFLAFLLLGERVSLLQIELIIVVFLSSLVVTFDEKWSLKSFFNRGVVLLLLAVVNLSLYGIYLNKSIALNNFWATTVFVPLISQALLLMTLPLFRKEIKTVNPKSLGAVGIMSVLGTFGTLAGNAALAKNVSISTVIISVPVSMILAFIFSLVAPELLEKHPIGVYAVRFLAAFVMISAAVKLSLM